MKKFSMLLIIALLSSSVIAQGQTRTTTGKGQQKPSQTKAANAKPASAAGTQKQADKPADKKEEDCGCDGPTPPPDVLATVNGVKIATKDVEEPIKDQLKSIQDEVIQIRKRELDSQIEAKLFKAEAARRGITPAKLFEIEVTAKTKEPTEAEAQAFYEQNKNQIQGDFASVKNDVVAYIRQQRQNQVLKSLTDQLRAKAKVTVTGDGATPPKTEAELTRVLASINTERITVGDIEEALKPVVYEAQEKLYDLRKQQLELKINDTLLEQEAQKKQTNPAALFESEIKSRLKPVTEEDTRKFYEENKDRFQDSYEQMKERLVKYLESQRMNEAITSYADQLRKGATVQVYLKAPDPPVLKIATDDQPSKGSATAPVTIVEFTDYQCPSCAYNQPIVEEVVNEFGDKVRLVVRDFPLEMHANAFKAAEAAEAAREQGKYWEYIALLFKNQKTLEVEHLKEYASAIGLDRKRFDEALDSGKYAEKVKRDQVDGQSLGVNSTPTVFINGRRLRDRSRESLKAAIEAAMKQSAKN